MIFLDPLNDIAFKKVFGSEEHKNITISFFELHFRVNPAKCYCLN